VAPPYTREKQQLYGTILFFLAFHAGIEAKLDIEATRMMVTWHQRRGLTQLHVFCRLDDDKFYV
jgi:hypothetical protein